MTTLPLTKPLAVSPTTLTGSHVQLTPLGQEHCAALQKAVLDGNLHEKWTTPIPSPAGMAAEIERRLALQAAGTGLPFVVMAVFEAAVEAAVEVAKAPQARVFSPIGMTSYMDIDHANRRLEIGSTWIAQSYQGSHVNTEMKFLLLQHAFETLGCVAVEFRTHFFNHQSRRAIERLGAKLDGILRNHRINHHPLAQADGQPTLRDTCVYSIIVPEWPTVKAHLLFKLRAV